MKEYLEAGKVINTHGVRGDVKLESWCDTPKVLAGLKKLYLFENNQYCELMVTKASVFKTMVIAHFEGSETFEDAVRYKNKVVYCKREDIAKDKNAVFIEDLIGLSVINKDSGKVYGTISDVIKNSANDIYEIDTEKGKAYMPGVKEFVKEIDLEKGVFVTPIEGMFDEI